MTPRLEVEWIDLLDEEAAIREHVKRSRHLCMPAARGSLDEIAGVIHTKDVLDSYLDGRTFHIRELVRQVPFVNETMNALDVIVTLRSGHAHMVMVVDEHGSFEGIVSEGDILETIAGKIDAASGAESAIVQRSDGSFLIDGAMPADLFAEALGIHVPQDRTYHTVAGFVLDNLRRFPAVGETFQSAAWRFEVADLDGLRIDKIIATRLAPLHRELR
jgi:putative hemolysin